MVALAVLLGGCAMSDDKLGAMFSDPAQYEFFTCPQLATQETALKTRLDELNGLMAKAATGTGGEVVNTLAYRPEALSVRGSLDTVRRTQAEKSCPPKPAPAAPPAPAAAKVAR